MYIYTHTYIYIYKDVKRYRKVLIHDKKNSQENGKKDRNL